MVESSTLYVHPVNDFTGSTRVLSNFIESEVKRVTIICQANDKGFLSNLSNVKLISYNEFRFGKIVIPFLSDFITRLKVFFLVLLHCRKFDTIYINTIVPYSAVLAARLMRKKVTYHVHEKFLTSNINYRIMEYVFNHTIAHRIFVSEYTKSQYAENSKCTWEVKYNKLSKSFLNKIIIRPIDMHKRNQVLMIASLSFDKGVDVFMKVAKQLPLLSFRLILSAQKSSIDDFFSGMEIPSNCEIIPSQSDIHSFLYDTDLLLSLTNPKYAVETFGMTILEAMSYGIPSIVPNIGGPTEIIENNYNGYCIDVTNVSLIVEYIHKTLNNDNYKRLYYNSLDRFASFK